MLLDLKNLIKKYNMNIKNIIHVGGHFGEEVVQYKEINTQTTVELFEPHPVTFQIMKNNVSRFSNVNCHNVALGSIKKQSTMFVEDANHGQSNSLLKPKHHAIQYPNIVFNKSITVNVNTLDSFNFNEFYNFMSLDVQGYELEVLKGSTNTLKNIDYIISEINNKELYENCCLVDEIDAFLFKFNFKRVETSWAGGTWGDGFYIKN